jgi:ribosomal-protein-alanine N-acetyltransferase
MSETKILRAGACDLAVLAELNALSFAAAPGEAAPGTAWTARSFAEVLALPGAFAFLALAAGQPVGFALGQALHGEAELLSLGVVPAARRAGHGRQLLAAIRAEALRLGARRLVLEVAEHNRRARQLYETAGFETVGQRKNYYRDAEGRGSDAAVLALSLEISKT